MKEENFKERGFLVVGRNGYGLKIPKVFVPLIITIFISAFIGWSLEFPKIVVILTLSKT